MSQSNIDKQIKRWTITVQCVGFLAAIGTGIALYLESYFASHPTVEDLYYGTNSRGDTLWAIALPCLGALLGYLFVGVFRIQNLKKLLPQPNQTKSAKHQPQPMSGSKAEELTKLSKLRAEGAISESEFASLKKEII